MINIFIFCQTSAEKQTIFTSHIDLVVVGIFRLKIDWLRFLVQTGRVYTAIYLV